MTQEQYDNNLERVCDDRSWYHSRSTACYTRLTNRNNKITDTETKLERE